VAYFVFYFLLNLFLLFFLDSHKASVLFYTLMGFPPFPLFFLKFVIVWILLSSLGAVVAPLVFGLLVANAGLLVLYYNFFSSRVVSLFRESFIL
jgi:lipid-A-disaccharide synthase-like uncharacterized protein